MLVKRNISACIALLLAVLLICPMTLVPDANAQADTNTENLSSDDASSREEEYEGLEDDFFNAINEEQFEIWEIPSTSPSVDHFSVLQAENQDRLYTIMEEAAANLSAEPGSDEANIGALWATAHDEEARNAGGYGKAQDFLDQVDAAKDTTELMGVMATFVRRFCIHSLFSFGLDTDAGNSEQMSYFLAGADTGLSREEWFSEEEETQEQVELYKAYLTQLWELNGASPEEAAVIVEEVTGVMKELAASSLTVAEQYDAEKYYNVYQLSDLEDLYKGVLPMERVYELFNGEPADKVIVLDPGLVEAVGTFLESADLDLVKNYVKSCLFVDLAKFATTDSQEAQRQYYKESLGLDELVDLDDDIATTVGAELSFECGRLYANQYFSDSIRSDIQAMIDDIVVVYEQRINGLSWLSDETKEEAITKLKSIESRIGVPEVWPQDQYNLELLRPEDGGLYVDNILAIYEVQSDAAFALKDEPVDKSLWVEAPQIVNAFYDPTSNSITLAAGILQAPFYDIDATPEENLARIGMVIGHEITHAFDSSGSQYDENGNLRDWWTEEDAERFAALSQEVVEYFDDQEVNGMSVNGELTLTENIADLGAVACVTEVAQNRGYDMQALYIAYAQLWAEEIRDEYLASTLATDPHAPSEVRTNAVLSATDGFYEAFDIDEDDAMYVAPEERPQIW